MALVLQDATTPTMDANTYAPITYFKAYHAARANDLSAYTDPAIEGALVKAVDYLDTRFKYRGDMVDPTQSTAFPRVDGDDVIGIPVGVFRAQCEYAYRLLTGALLYGDAAPSLGGRTVIEEKTKVGPIEESKKYGDTGAVGITKGVFPLADAMLEPYRVASGGMVIRV